MAEDPYRALGVSKDSTEAEIKRSYRKLARQYHPDRNPDDAAAEERFKSIQKAYEEIGTAEARREFDERKRMEEMFRGGNSFGGGNPFGGGVDLGDIFSQFMGGRGSSQQGFSRHPRPSSRRPPSRSETAKGANIESGLDISLEQANSGTEVRFSHRRLRRCERCNGTSFGTSRGCTACNGKGVQTKGSTLTVKVPPGAVHGQQLRLKDMGHEHPEGEPGDLLITLRLDAEEGRRWEEGRLIQEVPVPITTLLLGGKVRVLTPAGKKIEIDVPKGTRIGDRRRIQGQGYSGSPLDIEFVLDEPGKLTDAQAEALNSLRETGL